MRTAQTASFVGVRLREAREALGLSAQNVADLVEKHRVSITNYESGKTVPREPVIARLAGVLNQPIEFFFDAQVCDEYEESRTHFRTTKLLATEIHKASVRLKWVVEYFGFLEKNLELPNVNLPDLPSPPSHRTVVEHIEMAATQLREAWGVPVGPFVDLLRWAEANGVVVSRMDLGLPKLDGLSFYSERWQRPFVLLNATKASYVRSRFDLAHELGHMVLHRAVLAQWHQMVDHDRLEREAHRFASALLLPRDEWVQDLRGRITLGLLKALKPKWRTSIGAMIVRARDLGLISDDENVSLWKQMSSRRWRAREPFDDVWEPEEPQLLREATEMLAVPPLGLAVVQVGFNRAPRNLAEITAMPEQSFIPPSLLGSSGGLGSNVRGSN